MPRRGENVYKRKDGRWEGRILRDHTADHKPIYTYVYGHSYKEVKEKMEANRILTANQLHGSAQLAGKTTLSEVAEIWLASKKCKVKESTYAHYRNLIDRHILPSLGGASIRSITDDSLAHYTDTLLRSGRVDRKGGLSAKTSSDILILLKSILKYAGKQGCEIRAHLDEVVVRRQHQEMRVLTVQEQNRLADLFNNPADNRYIGVMISLYMGLRLGEVCALRWENVDMNERVIRVRATMQRVQNYADECKKTKVVITEPKSDCSVRDIPIPDFMMPILRQVQATGEAFVLTGCADKYVEPRSMENYFARCVAQCGIAPANYHALRHSFATRCVEAGFDIKSLSEILGHSNVSITLDRYVHSSFEQKKKNMAKLTMRFCA